jgi:hypothetical protein
MIESLRFFCERRVKGHGFVHLAPDEVIVALVGTPVSAPTPEELRHEWSEALKGFTQLFKLTYSTWNLPVYVRVTPASGATDPTGTDDSVEVA